MMNLDIKYNVTGRYMDGQKIIGYHLVGEDGSQLQETKDRVIWLINKGLILNMRIQIDAENNIIVRGKGVNLNNLPVFDITKQRFRGDSTSQTVANGKVSVEKSTIPNANKMGQYTILKRIMYKNTCLGYVVQDYSGNVTRKKRDDIIELALQKLISNAVAQKYRKDNKQVLILRGVDCDLSKLPILIVDPVTGNVIDPLVQKNNLSVRAAYMKSSGIIKDRTNNKTIQFKAGDFIICEPSGQLEIKQRMEIEKTYIKDKEMNKAICDDYLNNIDSYIIEIFGTKPIQLNKQMIQSWTILKPIKAA